MHKTKQMDEFSRAYVRAIVAQAGWNPYNFDIDDDSIDLGIGINDKGRTRLEIQLKCTGEPVDMTQETFPFDLKLKNYNDLRVESLVPRLLVVVCVPEDINTWTKQTEQELCLRHCGYWLSLVGMPDVTNKTKVRIQIPRNNIFSVKFLKNAMQRIASGGQI